MDQSNQSDNCLKFLKRLREKGKSYGEFQTSLAMLSEEASTKGLDDNVFKLLMEIIMHVDLGVRNCLSLIKCMIPRGKIDDADSKKLISWFLTTPLPVSPLCTILQWLIGCWEYQLINRRSIYIFYDSFFYIMLKKDRLESHLAHLIYLMTKPEDVTRRQVTRLLRLNEFYRKPQKHIIALLSLFKSYKPEFVPEKIPAINVQSIWRPIPEMMRAGFEDARDRIILKKTQMTDDLYCDWNVFNVPKSSKKNQQPLVPSVGYFNMGSNVFKLKTEKSIFDISSMAQLGQYQSIIALPCNATSLLTNVIGYHLLTYSHSQYQQRFMHNLYYTLWRSFIFENGRYSNEEMDQILEMTMEFCKYMQHGIPIVSYFINEYLSCYMDDFHIKLLSLMQWSTLSLPELQDYVLRNLKLMFYSSSLRVKCHIIRTLRALLLNLLVINDETFKDKSFPFLDQRFHNRLEESVQIIESFSRELIVSGLNTHFYNSEMISEALSFYEQIDALEIYKKTSFITLAPSAIMYGCFVTKSCAILSRICALLLQYRRYFKEQKDLTLNTQKTMKSIKRLIVYAEDLVSALWYDNSFSNRHAKNRYFLKSLSNNVVTNSLSDIDSLLNIHQHCAVLPYMYMLCKSGLQIKTKADANNVAAHYYVYINQFICALLGNWKSST